MKLTSVFATKTDIDSISCRCVLRAGCSKPFLPVEERREALSGGDSPTVTQLVAQLLSSLSWSLACLTMALLSNMPSVHSFILCSLFYAPST